MGNNLEYPSIGLSRGFIIQIINKTNVQLNKKINEKENSFILLIFNFREFYNWLFVP